MEKLEEKQRKQIRATKIQKAILNTVAAAGIISIAVLAPNALQALKMFGLKGKAKYNSKRVINNSRRRLMENGLIKYSKEGFISLTPEGEKFLRRIESSDYKVIKSQKWDKKWRILIFDIKESKKYLRDKVRNTLVCIGFMRLQNSVWVYPYDCEDLITLLKADFSIGKEILYIIADQIENEKVILEYFGINK